MRIHLPFHWTMRTWLGRSPVVFNAVFGSVNEGSRLTRPDTGLVIEGFPRSGNSFSVFAFSNAGAGELNIAHHVHSPSQIIRAARYGLPAVLLLRAPDDAVAAGLVKIGTHTAPDLYRAYAIYYRTLAPLRDHYVIAPFETVTTDFGRIVEAVNRRFGTTFEPISADRHALLSKAFLAQERIDAVSAPGTAGAGANAGGGPQTRYQGALADRARDQHGRFLEMARDDGTC
jgi:hypothetical protein